MNTIEYMHRLQEGYGLKVVPRPTVLAEKDKDIAEAIRAVLEVVLPALTQAPEIKVMLHAKYLRYQLYISSYFALSGWHAVFLPEENDNICVNGVAMLTLKPMSIIGF